MDPEALSKAQFYILLEMLRGSILQQRLGRYWLFNADTKRFSQKPSSVRTIASLLRHGFIAQDGNQIQITSAGHIKIEHEAGAGIFR